MSLENENQKRKRQKRHRRRMIVFFLVGILLGGVITIGYFSLYSIPKVTASFKEEFEKNDKEWVTLEKNVKKVKEKESAENELLRKKSEERKKRRVTFGKTNNGKEFSALSETINERLESAQYVGSILVVKNNQVVLEKGYGFADKNKNQLNNANSEFMIASLQKSLTAFLIMRLVEDGKLTLQTPLGQFYPEVPNSYSITIRNLLDMTSGLSLEKNKLNLSSEEEVVKYATDNLKYETPTKWNYSYVNYTLLAGIIRKVSGQSYQSYFESEIIEKLGLKHTGFYDSLDKRTERTFSYEGSSLDYKNQKKIDQGVYVSELGTGNVFMSVGDYFTYYQSLVDGRILKKELVKELRTSGKMPYSFTYSGGLYEKDGFAYGHGIFRGYEPTVFLSNDGSTGIITFSNYRTGNDVLPNVTQDIYKLITET